MKKTKLLTALLSVAMLFGAGAMMTACGTNVGNGGGNETSSSVNNEQSVSEESTESTPATKGVVTFDINLEGYTTNAVKSKTISIGKRVSKPQVFISSENPDNLQVYGWYTDADCTEQWDFKNDRVEGDMTLYAKWVSQYKVNFYVKNKLVKTELVFKGDKVEEDATLAAGFKYLGTYTDVGYQTAFNYETPISGNTDLFIQRSAGIYMSDHTEEGELPSGNLTDYLTAYIGSTSGVEEEGWVEAYTVDTVYGDKTVTEKCTYVNFGYQPIYGDGYVELCLPLDISESQIIRIWFKNLGSASKVNAYFTTMLDADNNVYSETGPIYTQDFCYPNYTGSSVGDAMALDAEQINMDATAEWTYIDFNLYEIYKNGYSVWGTSPYLGMLRIQANYINTSEDDMSNVFLIKAIEGIPYDIVVEDSDAVKELLSNAEKVTEQKLTEVSEAQPANPQGLVFPKDRSALFAVDGDARAYHTEEGLIFYSDNEILGREKGNPSSGFTLKVPEGKAIDLSELTTLSITLKNYGYAENLTVQVYNDIGIPVKAEIALSQVMNESKTYTVNLYGKYGMSGNLSKVAFLYNSVGVDNAILIENVQMSEFVPYDTVGINFNDKYCYGISSTEDVEVSFESNRSGTLFNVAKNGASVVSADRTYKATSDGYANATLQYYLYPDSEITAVTVEYRIDGAYTSAYKYELDTENKGITNAICLDLKSADRGFVQGIRLSFEGVGRVLIKGIDYGTGATGMPYYQSYEGVYKGWDWELTNKYEYDETLKASILKKDPTQKEMNVSIYIGISANNAHVGAPHTTKNVLVTETTKIKIVYQNRTEVSMLTVNAGFTDSELGNPDTSGRPFLQTYNNPIDCMMEEYEWSTLTIEVPTDYVGDYLGKIALGFMGDEIAIRAISIETEEVA